MFINRRFDFIIWHVHAWQHERRAAFLMKALNCEGKMSYHGGQNHRSTASSHCLAFILLTWGSLTTQEDDYPAQTLIWFTSINYRCSFSVKSCILILHCPRKEWNENSNLLIFLSVRLNTKQNTDICTYSFIVCQECQGFLVQALPKHTQTFPVFVTHPDDVKTVPKCKSMWMQHSTTQAHT